MLRSEQYVHFFPSARVSIASRSDSVMNRQDGLARETRASSEGDVAPGLSSFRDRSLDTGCSIRCGVKPRPHSGSFLLKDRGPPWLPRPRQRAAIRKAAMYASVAAAVAVGIAAGTWGARALQRSRPVATQMAAAPVVNTPVVTSPVDAPAEPSAELIPSVELRPSIGAPVARVVANPPQIAAASQAVPDDRQPRDAAASTPRGTSGGASAAARAVPAPRPRTEPVPPAVGSDGRDESRRDVTAARAAARGETPAPAAQPAPRIPAAIARPEPEALPSVVARSEQNEIQRTLGQYRSAYQRLDAQAAQAVWPSVDVRALARAFDTLSSQELAFETCLFDIAGPVATAQCRGSATYTPKVGGRGPKAERRQWTFRLRKVDEAWKIESAQARQ